MSGAMATHPTSATNWATYLPSVARVRLAIIAVLFLAVYWTTIRHDLMWKWTNDGNWSHGWLVPLFSLYMLHQHRERVFRTPLNPSYAGALVLLVALVVYFYSGWVLLMGYPQSFSIVLSIIGLVVLMGGWRLLRAVWFPIAYLLFAIPLPQNYYALATRPLRIIASSIAAAVMPLFAPGMHTEAQAVVIDYVIPGRPPGTLNVEEACSGMRLMMALAALGCAYAYLGDRPTWQRLVLAASIIPIAVACNAIRVTTTGLLFAYGHQDLARGTPHQLLGIAIMFLALGMFMLIGYVLSQLFVEEPGGADAA